MGEGSQRKRQPLPSTGAEGQSRRPSVQELEDAIPSSPFYFEEEDEEDEEEDENLLEIIIDTLTGTTFQVRVSPWETAAGLKNLLYRTQGIHSGDQHILFGQTELLDDLTLIDQGVQDGANLKLVLAMKGGPINTGRNHSNEDNLWKEFSDYMDVNR